MTKKTQISKSLIIALLILASMSWVSCTKKATNTTPIKHVVVLMMENRSFDHLLGWMNHSSGKFGNPRVEGLNGTECNPQLLGGNICVNSDSPDCVDYDPNHQYTATTERIFDCTFSKSNFTLFSDSPCKKHDSTTGKASMQGFVKSAQRGGNSGKVEMTGFKPENVPILAELANEFALFDNYFSSYPGSTFPNRLFYHTGTCNGCVANEQQTNEIKNKTINEVLVEHGLSWRQYVDGNYGCWFSFIDYFNTNVKNKTLFAPTESFYSDAANGKLANYTFINPACRVHPELNNTKSFGLANDQHPARSVKEGERLIKNVYEALRNGPLWNETLFVVTYDEHGGFYDHVSPPQKGVPNPDGKKNSYGFDFTRLGIRVPTVAISPWIEKGTLVKQPTSQQKPNETSQFEHTSIGSTIFKLFGIDASLSKRMDWAAHFDDLLKIRKQPRTDCPNQLTYIPPPTPEEIKRLYQKPLQQFVKDKLEELCGTHMPDDAECGKNIQTYSDLTHFIHNEAKNESFFASI